MASFQKRPPLPLPSLASRAEAPSPAAGLTRRMAAGEEDAFAEFHRDWVPRLFRYILVLQRGDEHAARDVLQETLLRVVRHRRHFEGEDAWWDWLAKLARCAAADHGRSRSRYRRLLERFGAEPREAAPPDSRQLEQAVAVALNRLSAPEAALLRGKYEEGLSQREIAERLAITEDAVESRLRRARATLRAAAFQILRSLET